MLPVYTAGFISLDKQFLTIGINGMAEAAESLGIEVGNNESYKSFVSKNLKIIFDSNKEAKKQPAMTPKEKKAAKREKKHTPAFAPMPKR